MKKVVLILVAFVAMATNLMADSWVQKATNPNMGTGMDASFSIGNKGYCFQRNTLGDMWEYNQVTDSWTQKATFTDTAWNNTPLGFAIGGIGYILFQDYGTLYAFNPVANIWETKTTYSLTTIWSVVFAVGNKAVFGT